MIADGRREHASLMPLPQRRAHLLLDRERLVDLGERALCVEHGPAELDERVARKRALPERRRRAQAAPSLSFSSITTRCAVLRPMPGIASKRARSSRAIARRSSARRRAGDDRERHLRADPGDAEQQLEELALVGEAKP